MQDVRTRVRANRADPARPHRARSAFDCYDRQSARRVCSILLLLNAVLLIVGAFVVGVPRPVLISTGVVIPGVLVCLAVVIARVESLVGPVLTLVGVFGAGLIALMDIVTLDASAGAQVAFCAPVMFAASQLRPWGAMAVLLAALTGEAAVVLRLEAFDQAVTDFGYVSGTLIAISLLLLFGARRQHRLLLKLEQQAAVDALTGLVTRRVLDDAAASALRGASSSTGTAMVLIDVDFFKSVNDTYGHPVGDDALTHIAEILRERVSDDAVISRLGGDELAVLMPGCDVDEAVKQARAILRAVTSRPLPIPGGELPLSVSIGVGYTARKGLDLRELYAAADTSLYEAKRGGRAQVGPPNFGEPPAEGVPQPRLETGG